MSYVGGPFSHDVFVSYSHGDADGESRLKLWSQAFARELESELKALPDLGGALSIFLDQHARPTSSVDPMSPLTEQLREQIAASAIVTVLMSPHYLRSIWCRNERDWWHEAQTKRQLPHQKRVAMARIWPLAPDATLPELFLDSRGQPLVGFWFYNRQEAEKHPQPYEWPAAEPTSKGPFRDALLELVGWLRVNLDALKATLVERQRANDEAAALAGATQLVYLHGRADKRGAWQATHDLLSQSGFAVTPNEPDRVERDPATVRELRRIRVETLSVCDALLLLGSDDGRALDADLVVVGRQDRQLARALSNRLLPCALLDNVGSLLATPQRRNSARALQVDWIDGTINHWVPELKRWLIEKSASLRDTR